MTTAGVHVIAGTEKGLLTSVDQESNKTDIGEGGQNQVVTVEQLLPEHNH